MPNSEGTIQITAPITDAHLAILNGDALGFVARLARAFEPRRRELLSARRARQEQIDRGVMPRFLDSTATIRESDWTVAPIPADLMDRRVEITGPVERKMIINALNSGAKVFMADFEDSNSPTWDNVIAGQVNLRIQLLEARPAAEVYWVQHGKSYSGMTTAKLAPIGAGQGGPIRAQVIWATTANYCLQSTVRRTTVQAFSVVMSKFAWRGPCPRPS